MISNFQGKTAVLTGAGSGFGLECARIGARLGMNLVLVDVQQDALDKAAEELRAHGVQVMAHKVDVGNAAAMEVLASQVKARFGAPHFVFNNAGVAAGGLVWENTVADWNWVLGVNLWGVIHGVRLFTPMMLEAARADPAYQGHIVNTASMAGLLTPPNMGIYNVSKHAVVALTETLYQDLALVTNQVGATTSGNALRIAGASGTTVYMGGTFVGSGTAGNNSLYITQPGTLATPSYRLAGNGAGDRRGVPSPRPSGGGAGGFIGPAALLIVRSIENKPKIVSPAATMGVSQAFPVRFSHSAMN